MATLAISGARLLTMARPGDERAPRRGRDLSDLGVIQQGWVVVEDGRVADVGIGPLPDDIHPTTHIHADGRIVMPALVDCHTHACWAGDRSNELVRQFGGAHYLDLLREGGGIMATVRAVRDAAEEELVDHLLLQLERMARLGAATVEVKSGYGLDPETELKMLRAIDTAARRTAQTICPTFLGAHALDRDAPGGTDAGVDAIIHEALPLAAAAFPGIACDAYCEDGAWSLNDCRRLFEAARDLGCPIRVHTDQFNSLGMTRLAVDMDARSVDHLEATTSDDARVLAASDTIGVLLPVSGFCLDDRYANGRELIDMGVAIAVASNSNPGSAQTTSLPFALSLACRKNGLHPSEAIVAATYNAACVLELQDECGSIEPGKRGDLIMLDTALEEAWVLGLASPGPVGMLLAGEWHDLGWS
jgi:imidazolonepropionase